jgi:hypothetical protein
MVDRAWAKASLFAKILEELGYLPGKRVGPRCLLGAVLTLRYDQTKEMPDGATREIAVASPRIGWPVQAPSRQPVDDERVEKRLRPLDAVSIARGGEFRELHQDGDPPKNAAGRIPSFAQGRHIKLDPRPEPAAHDPVDRLRLEEEAFQHGNLHSGRRE